MNSHTPHTGPRPPSVRGNLLVLAALFGLLALTAGSALVPMGAFNTVCNIGIAIAKALLVMLFYMRLKTDSPLLRIVAFSGFAWLALLIAMSVADVMTRSTNGF